VQRLDPGPFDADAVGRDRGDVHLDLRERGGKILGDPLIAGADVLEEIAAGRPAEAEERPEDEERQERPRGPPGGALVPRWPRHQ
jgi:hypothetical protein